MKAMKETILILGALSLPVLCHAEFISVTTQEFGDMTITTYTDDDGNVTTRTSQKFGDLTFDNYSDSNGGYASVTRQKIGNTTYCNTTISDERDISKTTTQPRMWTVGYDDCDEPEGFSELERDYNQNRRAIRQMQATLRDMKANPKTRQSEINKMKRDIRRAFYTELEMRRQAERQGEYDHWRTR